VGDALVSRRHPLTEPSPLSEILRSADVRFCNFETTVPDGRGYPASDWAGTYTSAPAGVIADLAAMGFNLFGRANNHAGDWREEGVMETTRAFAAAGVVHVGAGANLAEARRPAYLDLPSAKVALIAVATAPPGSPFRAGAQRPDCRGRPGASCLRFSHTLLIPEAEFAHLRRVLEQTPLAAERRESVDLGFAAADEPGTLSVGGVRFKPGPAYGEEWAAHPGDLDELLRSVRDARRQAGVVLVAFHAHESSPGAPGGIPSFHREFCRACIDAGADAVIGHGPHRLRGIEVYRDRPILYSLGNFIFENEEVEVLPADFYERLGLDPLLATPADAFDRRNARGRGGFLADGCYWRSVVAWWEYDGEQLRELRLYPVDLHRDRRRGERGRPTLAGEDLAREVAAEMDALSAPLGPRVTWQPEGYASVRW
jgi:poly-gamma-glutamate capsule biosynthesis protein CapA/YwtB (metallophosphatase superfamily)